MELDTANLLSGLLPQHWPVSPQSRAIATLTLLTQIRQIHLKLENLQPSGSFKSRGMGYFLLSHLRSAASAGNNASVSSTHFYSSSGGNAGLAVVCAAVELNSASSVVVPLNTSQYMIDKIRTAGAVDVIQHGESWSEANAYLHETVIPAARKRGENAVFVPPFDAPEIWTGHATMIHEIVQQLGASTPDSRGTPDLVICSVGGGGLFNGIMQGLAECGMPDVPVLAVETNGAQSLARSVEMNELITLDAITSIATTLGARTVSAKSFENAKRPNVKTLVLEDRDAISGCLDLAENHRILVEASCGVTIAAAGSKQLRTLFPHLTEKSNVVIIVCGGSNVTLDLLEKYKKQFSL